MTTKLTRPLFTVTFLAFFGCSQDPAGTEQAKLGGSLGAGASQPNGCGGPANGCYRSDSEQSCCAVGGTVLDQSRKCWTPLTKWADVPVLFCNREASYPFDQPHLCGGPTEAAFLGQRDSSGSFAAYFALSNKVTLNPATEGFDRLEYTSTDQDGTPLSSFTDCESQEQ
jgi:hypothetical protein